MNNILSVIRVRSIVQRCQLVLTAILFLALFPAGAYRASASPDGIQSPQPEIPLSGGSAVTAPQAGVEYYTAPPAAFLPTSQDYDIENGGRWLKANVSTANFRAPVYLPNGSHIEKISACFQDNSAPYTATLQLMYSPLDNGALTTEMGSVKSRTDVDPTIYDDTSVAPVINNNLALTYYFYLSLPPTFNASNYLYFCGASVTYTRQPNDHPSLSIPGAAFDRPFDDGYNLGHNQWGGILQHFHRRSDSNDGVYLAPVNLPHGSVVNKMTIYYADDDAGQIDVFLERSYLGSNLLMASATSQDIGYQTSDTTIISPTIDNINYSYWAFVNLPVGSQRLWAMTIEYTPPAIDGDKWAISPAAFTPSKDNYDYQNHGRWLFHLHDEDGLQDDGTYVAPVLLPQGARIDSLWATFYDGTTVYSGTAVLMRESLTESIVVSELSSTGSYGYTTPNDGYLDTFVDNQNFIYMVFWRLPPATLPDPPGSDDVVGVRISIYYTSFYPVFLPLVRK